MRQPTAAMQPSSKAAQSVSAAAEALFETKTVTEIRQIEARTRKDIEEKNMQLRQLVGDSYRDFIEGTDIVIDISNKCHAIMTNILAVQESFGSLARSVTTAAAGADGKDFVRKHQELHAVGSRVKYIMDTPEIIWGCLEAQQHLDAARRLLRVHEVHNQLQNAFAADMAAKFPLLSHQWPLVVKFRQQVLEVATSTLSSKPELSSQTAADAVSAIAMLEGLDSRAAMQQFLAGRRRWAEQLLEQALAECEQHGQEPGHVLAQLAQQVQCCIAQVGEMFTQGQSSDSTQPASSSASLLQRLLHEDEADVSELYFGGVNGSAEGNNSTEAVAWRQKSSDICHQLMPLPQAEVEQACSSWLSQISASCNQRVLQLLQHCSSAHSLLEAEQSVQQAVISWAPSPATSTDTSSAATAGPEDSTSATDQQPAAAGLSRPSTAAVGAASGTSSLPTKLSMVRGRAVSEWDVTCEQVLGQKVDLWQVLFHEPFLARCKHLIAEALQDACSSIQQPLTAALQQAVEHDPEPAGQLVPGTWPSITSHGGVAYGAVLDRTYSFVGDRTSSGAWNAGPAALGYTLSGALMGMLSGVPQAADAGNTDNFRNEVHTIKQLFDSRLHTALQAILLLTAAASEGPDSPGKLARSHSQALSRLGSLAPVPSQALSTPVADNKASGAAAAACAASGKARAADLEQHTQQQCVKLVQALAQQLQQQLQEIQQQTAGHGMIEQVLLIARLCSAVASGSVMLPVLLGPTDAWLPAAQAGPNAAAGSAAGAGSSSVPAAIAQGISSLGPAAAALLRMHHPELMQQSNAAKHAAAAQLTAIQQQLHSIACSGYAKWANWVATSLSSGLLAALSSDELLHSDVTPLSWAETTVAADGGDASSLLDPLDEAAAGGDMKFALPAVPSAAVLQMLSWACWETRRAGEHLVTTDALQLLQWELHGAALQALQQVAASSNATPTQSAMVTGNSSSDSRSISEKGVLQLLFDQRLLRDVVGAGRPLGSTSAVVADGGGPAGGELAARKRLVTSVEQQLQDRLDPIDWATYEPHLWTNVQRYYQRTAVLLGTLAQLQKPYTDTARAPAAASNDLNTLNLMPVAPRFHYLPVSTPTALHTTTAAKQRLSAAAGFAGAVGPSSAAAGPSGTTAAQGLLSLAGLTAAVSDLAAQYAFTDLSSSTSSKAAAAQGSSDHAAAGARAAAYAGGLHGTADAAAAAGASALSAIQARLQGSSFGALGSMLGDRAAEVTAMAQNFGDLLPSSGGLGGLGGGLGGLGGGLLSSFARKDAGQPTVGTRK